MDLILWRHAQAEDGIPDAARRLTSRGQADAARVAGWLNKRLGSSDVTVVSSPTRRTRQTAEAMGRSFEVSDRIGPQASADEVIEFAAWPDSRSGVLVIVGHQPWIGEAAALLLTGQPQPWQMRKGAFWWFSPRGTPEDPEVRVIAALSPDLLR